MWNISAEPMPSRISTPVRSFHSAYSAGGSASPAESAIRRQERSACSERAERRTLLKSVGTPVRKDGRCASIWSRTSSAVARPSKRTTVAPTRKGNIRFVPVAYPKKSLGTERQTSSSR